VAKVGNTACDVGAYEFQGIVVNTVSDSSPSGDGLCSLREAINNSNSPGVDTTGGDCGVGSGADVIHFTVSGTITLGSTLPAITNTTTIDGTGQTIAVDGAGSHQVLFVNSGAALNLANLTIAHGSSPSNGGGINNSGALTVTNSTISSNTAINADGGGISSTGTLTVKPPSLLELPTVPPPLGLPGAPVRAAGRVSNAASSARVAAGAAAGGATLEILWASGGRLAPRSSP
jgi:CSLREA domain-containing protein